MNDTEKTDAGATVGIREFSRLANIPRMTVLRMAKRGELKTADRITRTVGILVSELEKFKRK